VGETSSVEPVTDERDYERLFREALPSLWRALYGFAGGRRQVAEDAIAEAFARAIEHDRSVRDPLAYVYRTAFRLASAELQRDKKRGAFPDEHAVEAPDLIDLMRALDTLPPRQRAAVILHDEEGYPIADVARLIGIAPATVRVHLHRGRTRLRALLSLEEVGEHDERWQRELTKLRDVPPPPGDLWSRVEQGPRISAAGEGIPRRALTIAIASLVAIAAVALLWIALRPLRDDKPVPGALGVLEAPPVGEVAPGNLEDGRPVFVVHREDGIVEVIDAFSTHDPGGLGKLIAWCPSSRGFEDPFHGSKWDENGSYLLGPAPTGLATYEATVRNDGRVVVGSTIPPAGRDSVPTEHIAGPYCAHYTARVYPTLPTAVYPSPSAGVAAAPAGWVTVQGNLLLGSTGGAELCDGPTCADSAPVGGLDTQEIWGEHPWYVIRGTFIARVQDGTLVDITRVFRKGV
jgi:RNA polymerase sigma-70 factor (ECF subfamily)